jgi:hypothetical protein
MNPDGSFLPGVMNFAITPAMNPMMIVQMMCMAIPLSCGPADLVEDDLRRSSPH